MQSIICCKECTFETGRHPGCHDSCKYYQTMKKEYNKERKKIQKLRQYSCDMDSHIIATKERNRKRKRA